MYTFKQYQREASRTMNKDLEKTMALTNGVMGLNGEAGEVIDVVKKYLFQGHDLNRAQLIDEVSDCMWYIAQICESLDIGMDVVAQHNIEKLKKRYPQGFNPEASINRVE